jgi:putative addiction module CopG family antidote
MNISLPDSLKTFVDEQVSQRGYGTCSEYVHELIRKDQLFREFAASRGRTCRVNARSVSPSVLEPSA